MAYLRRRAEGRRPDIISARLGSSWYACFRGRKYRYAETTLLVISNQRKVKENINNNLSN